MEELSSFPAILCAVLSKSIIATVFEAGNSFWRTLLLWLVITLLKWTGPGLNPQTSLKPESRAKIGFDNFILPEVPDVKPQASLSIDPYDSEEVDFEDLDRRLEILKKTT